MAKCGMNPGEFRHRVELHSPTTARDSYGQPIETFAKYADVWAKIEPMSMRERTYAEQLQGERTHLVTVRYSVSIDRTHRIIFGARTFEIVSILNPEERRAVLQIECKEID